MKTTKSLIGVMVVSAALAVPAAQAGGRPDDRAGLHGPGAFEQADAGVTRPDDRAVHGVVVEQATERVVLRPDDRPGPRGPGAATTVVVPSSTSSFDWGDALIGVVGGVGAALLLAGGMFVLMAQRSKTRVA